MLGAAIIVFRETLEAALILGIIAAATRGVLGRGNWLAAGVVAGILGALMVAGLTERIGQMANGIGQEMFNAAVLAIAVVMLAWHNIWMSRHGAQMAREAKQVGRDVSAGTKDLHVLLVVVALAVLREGSETVLFLYGLASSSNAGLSSVIYGAALGLAAGAAAGIALYAGFLSIPSKWFFSATSGLILLLAASMSSQMARFLVQGDVLPSLASPVWDTSGLLANDSALGTLLHALMGYDAAPAGMQVIFYLCTFIVILFGMRRAQRPISNTN